MTQKWIAELKQKTGRSLDEWLKFIKKEGPLTEGGWQSVQSAKAKKWATRTRI